MGDTKNGNDFTCAIAACLCSDSALQSGPPKDVVELVRATLYGSSQCPKFEHFSRFADSPPSSHDELQSLQNTISQYLSQCQCHDTVSLVYGGATKIKGYVFESPRLPEIRGASALLDWINGPALTDLWIETLKDVLPDGVAEQCIVYASGGNILGFAPTSKGQELAAKIEHCYTEHTLTANSVAVAANFSVLELRYGRNPLGYWVEQFLDDWKTPAKRELLEHYYYYPPNDDIPDDDSDAAVIKRFFNRKTFGELVTVLATMANRRRDERASHGEERSVPFYMLMPWDTKCASSDVRPAVGMMRTGDDQEGTPMSEASARKRYVGQRVKREGRDATRWFRTQFGEWDIEGIADKSWETKWRDYLDLEENKNHPYATACSQHTVRAARDVHEVGAASQGGYIGLIYADGNNVGRLIATLTTPQAYADTSGILAGAAVDAVFKALLDQLGGPVECVARSGQNKGQKEWVHPFEILAIGGDDLFLIVPGSKAFEIALAIGYEFEQMLAEKLNIPESAAPQSRYGAPSGEYIPYIEQFYTLRPKLGLSAGVVIAHHNAPIFFLQDLVEQLLKSAKKLARKNATHHTYYGGAVDCMVLKSISMVTDKISTFRRDALGDYRGQNNEQPVYSLTARPYTWHEFAGLLESVKQIKTEDVPRSQLYRLREVLMGAHERSEGIVRSVMEYLYTRVRLKKHAHTLEQHIDTRWCVVDSDTPPLPPWRKVGGPASKQWETVWADIIEMYDMVEKEEKDKKEAGYDNSTLP